MATKFPDIAKRAIKHTLIGLTLDDFVHLSATLLDPFWYKSKLKYAIINVRSLR